MTMDLIIEIQQNQNIKQEFYKTHYS